MVKARSPEAHEFNDVVEFLDTQLRENNSTWTIKAEYPTALTPSNIHNMSIITDEADEHKIISHAVLKPIITKTPQAIYKIGAIGSVVTAPEYRNQGLSSLNMQNCLTKATAQNCDLVVLWTDKHDFYRKFGFELAGFENTYVFDHELPQQTVHTKFITGPQVDPAALLKLYSQHSVGSIRTIEDMHQYMKIPNTQIYTAWSNTNQLLAYAIEGKGVDLQSFIHEWGGQVSAIIDLMSYMTKTENKAFHLMVPQHAQNLRTALDKIGVFCHRGFLGMIRIHDFESIAVKVKKAFRAEGFDQIVLEKQNDQIIFGYGTDLYTLDHESDLAKILFGPTQIQDMAFIQPQTRDILAKVLPMPIWVWGWDSI